METHGTHGGDFHRNPPGLRTKGSLELGQQSEAAKPKRDSLGSMYVWAGQLGPGVFRKEAAPWGDPLSLSP